MIYIIYISRNPLHSSIKKSFNSDLPRMYYISKQTLKKKKIAKGKNRFVTF